jgi:hypothetical protein
MEEGQTTQKKKDRQLKRRRTGNSKEEGQTTQKKKDKRINNNNKKRTQKTKD